MYQTIEQALAEAGQYHNQGMLIEAGAAYEWVVARYPNHGAALHGLGIVAAQIGNLDRSITLIQRAIAATPNDAIYHTNLGMVLESAGRLPEAINSYARAAELNPGDADLRYKLGNAFRGAGQLPAAMGHFRAAIQLNPNHAAAMNNLGAGMKLEGNFADAVACFQAVLRLNPDDHGALVNLGGVLGRLDRNQEAIVCYQRALVLKPGDRAVERALVEMHSCYAYGLRFDPGADNASIKAALAQWNRLRLAYDHVIVQPHSSDRNPNRRLRIGYLSPDFRDHVAGRNLLPLFLHHDHQAFEIFCYSNNPNDDHRTEDFRRHSDHFISVRNDSDDDAATRIRNDHIDLLIDPVLHMDNHRHGILVRKPAPVQITFGYPGSTGLTTIDYRVTDPFLDPPDQDDSIYSEKTRRLSASFWCYDPLGDEPAITELPALTRGHITFGCLNHFRKINPGVLRLWAEVLKAVPRSRLLILVNHPANRQGTTEIFKQAGISSDRIEFHSACPRHDYLRLYNQMDISLDCVPCNGHTTSLDSIFMGVPVTTLVGPTIVGRGGLSLLTNLNLPELIARTPADYVRITAQLAADVPRLSTLRQTLRERMKNSPLMDAVRFTRDAESIYREVWTQWCAGGS